MALIFDFLAIREQTRRVMAGEQTRRLDWRTPPSLVHNHGPEDGPGLGCPERRINGRLVGRCIKPTDPDAA